MKTIRFTQAQTVKREGKPDLVYEAGPEYTLRDDRANRWLRRGVAEEVKDDKPAESPVGTAPKITPADYDAAAKKIEAGEFTIDYAAPQMAGHFKLEAEDVRRELEKRVDVLKKSKPEALTDEVYATAVESIATGKAEMDAAVDDIVTRCKADPGTVRFELKKRLEQREPKSTASTSQPAAATEKPVASADAAKGHTASQQTSAETKKESASPRRSTGAQSSGADKSGAGKTDFQSSETSKSFIKGD